MTFAIYLIITVVVVGFFDYAVYSFLDGFWKVKEKQKADYNTLQIGLDDQLRTEGHSKEYVEKERTIRELKVKRRGAKGGIIGIWTFAISFLIFAPPAGIFFTLFAIFVTVQGHRKLRKEMRDTAYEIKNVRESMPEK
jgi:hypothetical protein